MCYEYEYQIWKQQSQIKKEEVPEVEESKKENAEAQVPAVKSAKFA